MSSTSKTVARRPVEEESGGSVRDTGTLGKAMAVLEIVASSDHPPRFTDILRDSDQPRGTLHRQLSNLVEEGLLIARPDQSYELGLRLHSQIGNASPAYCTGVGKAALSQLDTKTLSERITSMKFQQFTEHTLRTAKALRTEIADIRAEGVAYDREEHEPGIHCVAAPIYSAARNLYAGLSVTGPSFRVSRAQLEGWADTVRETANAITIDLETRLGPRA